MAEAEWKLPRSPLSLRQEGEQTLVWDPVRKDWYVLQPEEEVRQHLIRWLTEQKGISMGRVAVEKEISYRGTRRRFDLVVFDADGKPWLLCECKAPQVPITQDTINQIARYNQALGAPLLLVTNGIGLAVFSRQPDGRFAFHPNW